MTKQEKIKKLIEMQKSFLEKEQREGVSMREYFLPAEGSELHNYREEYRNTAMEVVKDAHKDVGSSG